MEVVYRQVQKVQTNKFRKLLQDMKRSGNLHLAKCAVIAVELDIDVYHTAQ